MYCKNCGQEIADDTVRCPSCGTTQEAPAQEDKGGFLWGLLGCCIPLVGLILFLVWKDSKPKTSKSAGIGAIVGVACIVVFYIIFFLIGIGIGVSGMY